MSLLMSDRITWAKVERDLHVASRDGEYVGMVEATADGWFVAFDGWSTPIGRYPDLRAAKASLRSTESPRNVRRRRVRHRAAVTAATVSGAAAASLALTAGVLMVGL